MSVSTKYFPFLMGLGQSTDDRLLEPGRPRAIENLAIRKRGRLGMRYDYDTLPMTTQLGGVVSFFDLASFGDRLLAFGEASGLYTPLAAADVYSFENRALYAWRSSGQFEVPHLPLAGHLRNMGALSQRPLTITQYDLAAGNGLVCLVALEVDIFANTLISVHVFNPATDSTVLYEDIFVAASGGKFPRVVCTGTKFFIGYVDGTTPKLWRYDPAVDTILTALPDPAAAGGAINCFDMSLAHTGGTFWMAYGRTGPLTRVHGFDVNGTETHDFAGPAVLANAITVLTEFTIGGVGRINLAVVVNGTNAVNMSTYLTATSALQTNTPAMYAGALSQVAMAVNGLQASPNITANYQRLILGIQSVTAEGFVSSTHVVVSPAGTFPYYNARLNSKSLTAKSRTIYGVFLTEGLDGSGTHLLMNQSYDNPFFLYEPAATADRLTAALSSIFQLQNLAFDAATGLVYWGRLIVSQTGTSRPIVSELPLAATDRRQTALLGDCLYISGGILSVYDGRALAEAGFIDRSVCSTPTPTAGGSLDLLGVYQFVVVFEYYDAKGNRIQSPPSDVVTGTLTAANRSLIVGATGSHSVRSDFDIVGTFGNVSRPPSIVLYRTKNNSGGNLTFYRDQAIPDTGVPGQQVQFTSTQSDLLLGANEILYTQGERGAQSGPLPFVAPEGCASLVASADRILSGGLASSSSVEESRPLLTGEETNWSDSIGFQRAVRGRVLAVARLDERRIIFTETELFEMDGPGLDDNGIGDIGAPRRLPSDVGLYGGRLGWRSMAECSLGIFFQGLADQIYLLPRGGVTPQAIGIDVQDLLAAFPTITSAVYMAADQTVRFTCNNVGLTDSIQLLYDVTQEQWVTEGPYGVPTAAAAQYQGRLVTLQNNVVRQQRAAHPPASVIANAWRSGTIHPFGLGQFGHILNYQFYGEYQGDCAIRAIATYDDTTVEILDTYEVNAVGASVALFQTNNRFFTGTGNATTQLTVGGPASFKFTPNQIKCESVRVDFEVSSPFPNVISQSGLITGAGVAATSIALTLPAFRAIGDRVVVVINLSNPGAGIVSAAGWTSRLFTAFGALHQVNVLERILDGSEASTVTFSWGIGTTAILNAWTLRNSHPTASIELSTAVSSGVTSRNTVALTPSWGLKNTRWLSSMAASSNPTNLAAPDFPAVPNCVSQFLSQHRGTTQGATNVSANLDGALRTFDMAAAVATMPSLSTPWLVDAATDMMALTIAIRPSDTVPSAGLVYHYWAMDVEDAGKSALKSPLQMG